MPKLTTSYYQRQIDRTKLIKIYDFKYMYFKNLIRYNSTHLLIAYFLITLLYLKEKINEELPVRHRFDLLLLHEIIHV